MINSDKYSRLRQLLTEMSSVLVAFSGGVDSTFLLKAAIDCLGPDRVLAVTAVSATYPPGDRETAQEAVRLLKARQVIVTTDELANETFVQNPPERCYHCKQELFQKLLTLAGREGLAYVVDGANADDAHDFRPGMKAGRELGVRSPLLEAGLTKDDIRTMAREQGLPNWNKPSMPCLSSRFPYGHRITSDKLQQVDSAESFLKSLGFDNLRVRHHGDIARIEVPAEDIAALAAPPVRNQITDKFSSLGFRYVTLDLTGFRSGSMNEVLPEEIRHG